MKNISRVRSSIMGVAALWICLFHIFPRATLSFVPGHLGDFFCAIGHCGVDMFLLMSSFGLVYAFSRKPVCGLGGYLQYLKKRLWRLYIVFLPVTIVIAWREVWTVPQFFLRLVGIDQLCHDIYDYLWFMPCILIFYLLAPLYYRLYQKVKYRLAFTLAVIALCVCADCLLQQWIRMDLFGIVHRIPSFLLGFYFGDLSMRETKRTKTVSWLILMPLMVVGLGYSYSLYLGWIPNIVPANNALANLLIAPGLVFLLAQIFTALAKCRVGDAVTKIFAFWGGISFEFYCIQEFAWREFAALPFPREILRLVVCFVVITASSYLVHLLGKALTKMRRGRAV